MPFLSLSYNVKLPSYTKYSDVIRESPAITNVYSQNPVVRTEDNKIVGYKTATFTLQEIKPEKHSIKEFQNIILDGRGSISFEFCYFSTKHSNFFPPGNAFVTNITSADGEFTGVTGTVTILPLESGKRFVTIEYN